MTASGVRNSNSEGSTVLWVVARERDLSVRAVSLTARVGVERNGAIMGVRRLLIGTLALGIAIQSPTWQLSGECPACHRTGS